MRGQCLAEILIILSAGIILLLGAVHLLYTFTGNKLKPRDAGLQAKMTHIHPNITTQTSMWKAWVGFNASHSMGAILFGLIYTYLAMVHPELLFRSQFLLLVGVCFLVCWLILAIGYWFRIPLIGIGLALVCFISGILSYPY